MHNLLCLTINTRLGQEESNGQIFYWTLLKSIKGEIIVNTYWELAYTIKQTRRTLLSIQVRRGEKLQLYFDRPRAAENRLMYLVSATLGSYDSTDYSHFIEKKKQIKKKANKKEKENVYNMKLKMCKSLWFKGKGRNHISISLETSSALDNF